jgi:energy-coupling factor transporter transmembrane protein EcfT
MNEFNKGILLLFLFLLSFEVFAESKWKWLWVIVCAILFTAGSISAAVIKIEKFEVSLAISVIMTAICLGYLWFERTTRRSEKAARRYAVKQGLAVTEVERDMPCAAKGAKTAALAATSMAKYAFPRKPVGKPADWSFLRRTQGSGVAYDHGWLFTCAEGQPSEAMAATLRAISAHARDECLEFEAAGTEVCAYWKEWGGAEHAEDIHLWLQELAQY